jgi:hypothetical protein
MDIPSVKADTPPVSSDYLHALEELTNLYKMTYKSLLCMPMASVQPRRHLRNA